MKINNIIREGKSPDPKVVAKFADVRPQDRSYYIMKWAEKKGIDSDDAMELAGYVRDGYIGAGAWNWRYVGMDENVAEETVVEDSKVELINELRDILDELDQLGEQAHNIVRMIDRSEAERLDAYGAFNFGSSDNRYDTTLASFLEDLESGQYSESKTKQRLDPKCWKGYKKQGTKMKGGVRVNNCVKESKQALARHVKEGVPLPDSLFRYQSEAYFDTFKYAKQLREAGALPELDWESEEMLGTDIGESVELKGIGKVWLDVPYLDESALAEDYDPKLITMLARFERDCNDHYRYYGDTDVVSVAELLKQGREEDAAEEMAGAMSDQDGGSNEFDDIYDMALDHVQNYVESLKEGTGTRPCPCCNGGKGPCSHGKPKCGTCNGTGVVPADFETEEFPLDEGKGLIRGGVLTLGILAGLMQVNANMAQKAYDNSPQLQQLVQHLEKAEKAGDDRMVAQLTQRIANHKMRIDIGKGEVMGKDGRPIDVVYDKDVKEAEYQGKDVELNKPKRGGSKKYYVYVKNPKTGKVKKISFGDPGLKTKSGNKGRAKSFAARHNCEKKNDKTKAGYWACRLPRYGLVKGGKWW